MSPALLNKYLQAAREVAEHLVLTPDGFDFAPYPMLVETDRDKYAIERIVDFYQRQPTDFADYFEAAWRFKLPRRPRQARRHPGLHRGGCQSERQVSAAGLADPARRRMPPVPSPSCRPCGTRCRRPARARRMTSARAVRRHARFRGPDPQRHRHAVRRAEGARTAARLAAAARTGSTASSPRTAAIATPTTCATIPTRRRRCPSSRDIPACTRRPRRAGPRSPPWPAPAIPIWWFPPPNAAAMKPPLRASLPFSPTPSTSANAAAISRTIPKTKAAC